MRGSRDSSARLLTQITGNGDDGEKEGSAAVSLFMSANNASDR